MQVCHIHINVNISGSWEAIYYFFYHTIVFNHLQQFDLMLVSYTIKSNVYGTLLKSASD